MVLPDLRAPFLASLCVACASAPDTSTAPADALVPSPSVFDFTRGEGVGLALGAAVEYETAYDGSDEYELEIEPAGAIQYRVGDNLFFFEGIELGWRGRVADRWLLQAGARDEGGREASDSDDGRLDGLDDVDDHIVGFLEARYAFDDDWRNWVAARAMVGESDFGALGVLAAGHRFGDARDGAGSEVFGFATFGDSTFIDKDFGISPAESMRTGLEATDLGGGFRSLGLQYVYRRNLARQVQLIFSAGLEAYSSEIRGSDITRDDVEAEVGLAVVWWL